jgi:hypothetical protein
MENLEGLLHIICNELKVVTPLNPSGTPTSPSLSLTRRVPSLSPANGRRGPILG